MIKITELGPNSCAINVIGEANLNNLANEITTWLAAHGWELYDNWQATKKVYRAVCADGTTYKYAILDMTTPASVYLNIAESWNATTHVGTNVNTNASYCSTAVTTNSTVYLFASPRYFAFLTKVNGAFNNTIMVLEHARENTIAKVLAYPPFIATATDGMTTVAGVGISRSSLGTAAAANANYALISPMSCRLHPAMGNNYQFVESGYLETKGVLNAFCSYDFYASFSNARLEHRGKLFGIKVGPANFGTVMDRISLKCDANGFSDQDGSDVEHFIIPSGTWGYTRFAIPV